VQLASCTSRRKWIGDYKPVFLPSRGHGFFEIMSERHVSSGRHILVVDDDDAIRRLVGKLLEMVGYTFAGARDGAEALEKVRESNPDLILLDHVLPDMNGILLLELIRAQSGSRHTPIIYLTGITDIPTKTKAFEAGAIDYVTKPFDPSELLARVGMQIRLKDQRDAEAREKRE
jgi:DNA-binding response OmpR family regulator